MTAVEYAWRQFAVGAGSNEYSIEAYDCDDFFIPENPSLYCCLLNCLIWSLGESIIEPFNKALTDLNIKLVNNMISCANVKKIGSALNIRMDTIKESQLKGESIYAKSKCDILVYISEGHYTLIKKRGNLKNIID